MARKKIWYMFPKLGRVRLRWVFQKLASFFVGGLIITIVLTAAYSLASYIADLSNNYDTRLSWEIIKKEFQQPEAARVVVDNLSVSMCIWALLEVSVNTKSTIQRKFRRIVIVYIIICIIWFTVEKLIDDGQGLIILDFVLISMLIICSWIHDFLKDTENINRRIGTGRDDGTVSNIMLVE